MAVPAVARKTFKTGIDLPEKARQQAVELLNARLADAIDLKTQTKYAHWNVKGMHFQPLHELFDLVAGHLEEHADLLAERATTLGGVAAGTARQVAAASSLEEFPFEAVAGEDCVRALVSRLAKYGAAIRAGIDAAAQFGDQTTADLFTEVSRAVDKDLWFLEAHLQE